MKVSFAIIGNNWGNKVFSILDNSNYNVTKISIRSPKRYKNYNEYLSQLKKQLNLIKKRHNIIWVAISPNKKNQFNVVKECLKKKFNLILEKPWMVSNKKTEILKKIQKKNKTLVGFNYEYIYLDFFKKNKKYFDKEVKKVILNFHVINKKLEKNHFLELGTHLVAIKKYYFPNLNNYKISTGNKKNFRNIFIKMNKRDLNYNFTYNKEKIVQKFIKDYIQHLKKKKKFKFDFNFAEIN
tara:strand:+ start:41 stop:757 length:717 start_codon:yes stop_codon:yes gene_type:complete